MIEILILWYIVVTNRYKPKFSDCMSGLSGVHFNHYLVMYYLLLNDFVGCVHLGKGEIFERSS